MVKDVTGKEMKAIDVFTMAIEYLVKELHVSIRRDYRCGYIQESDIKLVLNLPTNSNESTNQFLNEALVKVFIR